MEILVQRLDAEAVAPRYAHEGDAGCDLIANEQTTLKARGGRALVGTGIAVAIPEGHGGFVLPRSGLASKHGVTCVNAPGLIDAGYRGEVRVALVNLDPEHDYTVERGDRIAQLVVMPVTALQFQFTDDLPTAKRDAAGFGSTGR
jgi:dUTP pyrophosphatase